MPNKRPEDFYDSKGIAILGMSKKRKNFAWAIYDEFAKRGLPVFPVHPSGGESRGVRFYDSLEAVPGHADGMVDAAVVSMKAFDAEDLLAGLKAGGIRKIWFQQGSCDDRLLQKADMGDFETYTGCAIMYLPDVMWLHRVHRFFHELVSKGKN